MNAPLRAFSIITPETLERCGLRLELAASVYYAHCAKPATGDDDFDEAELARVEQPYLEARTAYRAALELITGGDAEAIERRLSC